MTDHPMAGNETGEPPDGGDRAGGPWWARHLVAIAGGFGVGLLVYRYGVLPFEVRTGPAITYLWLGLGALATARKAFRAGVGDVTSGVLSRARVGVGLLAAGVAFALAALASPPFGYLRLARRSFPGFDVALPAVGDVKQPLSTYAQGRITIGRPGRFAGLVQVAWEPGGMPDDHDLNAIRLAFASGLNESATEATLEPQADTVASGGGKTWVVHAGAQDISVTFVPCGGRRIMIATMGAGGGTRLHRRVVGTLRCHADPAGKASLGDVPVVFDLGKEWLRVPSTPEQLHLTDGRLLLMARSIAGTDVADETVRLMTAAPGMHIGARDGDHWLMEMEAGGEKQRGWLLARDCPGLGQTLLLMSAGEEVPSARALTLLRAARCRPAGEEPQRWPAWPASSR